MREPKFYQLILRKNTIKHISALLKIKFPSNAVDAVLPAMEEIKDLQRLEELHLAAVQARNIEAFTQMLHESEHVVRQQATNLCENLNFTNSKRK